MKAALFALVLIVALAEASAWCKLNGYWYPAGRHNFQTKTCTCHSNGLWGCVGARRCRFPGQNGLYNAGGTYRFHGGIVCKCTSQGMASCVAKRILEDGTEAEDLNQVEGVMSESKIMKRILAVLGEKKNE